MPAKTNHPCFKQPEESSIKLWRYMDFAKFCSLLTSRELFFCRSDLFQDPFEGSFPKANLAAIHGVHENAGKISDWLRQWTYISCWHASQFESAAMWSLYARSNDAVAIETRYDLLVEVLPNSAYCGLVKYIDYENDYFSEMNEYERFMNKRKSFEHEKEVRAVIKKYPESHNGIAGSVQNEISGISESVNLNVLITKVHVSPLAPSWLLGVTKEISKKYGLDCCVKQSNLYADPAF